MAYIIVVCKPTNYAHLRSNDGPHAVKSPRVLDKLEKHKITATFFMIGQLINDDTKRRNRPDRVDALRNRESFMVDGRHGRNDAR